MPKKRKPLQLKLDPFARVKRRLKARGIHPHPLLVYGITSYGQRAVKMEEIIRNHELTKSIGLHADLHVVLGNPLSEYKIQYTKGKHGDINALRVAVRARDIPALQAHFRDRIFEYAKETFIRPPFNVTWDGVLEAAVDRAKEQFHKLADDNIPKFLEKIERPEADPDLTLAVLSRALHDVLIRDGSAFIFKRGAVR